MRFAPLFVSAYKPKNLPTAFLFKGISHKLSFGAIFISDMFGCRVVVFLKFLVYSALAKRTADSDILLLKDVMQRILQTVAYISRLRLAAKQEPAVKDAALAF